MATPETEPSPPPLSHPWQKLLSVTTGTGYAARDFDWVARSVPCYEACPARTDIPAYLAAIARGDEAEAYRINLRDNVFPGVLGRVCTRPCEQACRHGEPAHGEPVAICASKRAAAEACASQDLVTLPHQAGPSGKRVGIVGAGPAGLAAARELALMGHRVELYERGDRAGGLMAQGIPSFRLPRPIVEKEVAQVLRCGITLHCRTEISTPRQLEELLGAHDAVLLATGAQQRTLPRLPGSDLAGVCHGLDFLEQAYRDRPSLKGQAVVIIGGGFTACDCARTAQRLGAATVRIAYRRTAEALYVGPHELTALREENITLQTQLVPLAFHGEAGRVASITFARTAPSGRDESGRPGWALIAGSEFGQPADLVILATGQAPDTRWIPRHPAATLFMAGDLAGGSGSLIEAIASGKRVARKLDEFLAGRSRWREGVQVDSLVRTGRTRAMDSIPRQAVPLHPPGQRDLDTEVEYPWDRASAVREAQRCYLCHDKFEIDDEYCIYCDRCLKAKPLDDCIVKISHLAEDSEGRFTQAVAWSGSGPYRLHIDPARCIRCGACRDICPMACISLQRVTPVVLPAP